MRTIKLTFTKPEYVEKLLSDPNFIQNSAYLKPRKLDGFNIAFNDPVQEHTLFDTEVVVLSICGRAIKNLIYQEVVGDIAFNNPYIGQLKGGINLNGYRIINSTDVQV